MEKIKNFFKDFISFHRLTKYGINTTGSAYSKNKSYWYVFITAVCSMIITGQLMSDYDTWFAVELLFFAFSATGLAVGIITAVKPSLLAVAPFSPKQKVVYSYMSALLNGLIFVVAWMAVMAVGVLIVALVTFIITGENILVVAPETAEEMVRLSAYGSAWNAEIGIIFAFGLFAVSHINSAKIRLIADVSFLAGLEIATLILVNICGRYSGGSSSFFFSADTLQGIDNLPHPWVLILIGGILSVCAIAASVWSCIMRHKSSKI